MNAVLRFADPASAAAAAADMAAGAATDTVRPDSAVPIPGHPEARALNNTYNTYGSDPHPVTVVAFTAHGAYVLCQTAQAHETTSAAALITKTLDLQGPRIDEFVPTDPSKFADLLADPTGLLAHTMPPPMWPEPQSAAPANPKAGVYQPRAALHFQNDPPSAAAAFSAAGLIVMSHNHTFVYQARDAAAAARLTIDLANSVVNQDSSATPVDGVDFLPTSRCMQFRGITAGGPAQYSCYAPADAFTIEAHDADALGAHEQIAAQYKMLLAN
jgi:hypothetical protein